MAPRQVRQPEVESDQALHLIFTGNTQTGTGFLIDGRINESSLAPSKDEINARFGMDRTRYEKRPLIPLDRIAYSCRNIKVPSDRRPVMVRDTEHATVVRRLLVINLNAVIRHFDDRRFRILQPHGTAAENQYFVIRLSPPPMLGIEPKFLWFHASH